MTRMPARRDGLLSRSVGSETVVYDDAAATAHSLSPLATAVFGLCDGRSSVLDAAATLGLSVEEVSTALLTLTSLGLVEGSGMTRRSAMQKAGLVGVGALAVSVAAPLAAAHASETATTGGFTPAVVLTDDFESTPPVASYQTYNAGDTLDGIWTVGGAGVDVVAATFNGNPSGATSQYLDSNALAPGSLTSIASFGVGSYALTFNAANVSGSAGSVTFTVGDSAAQTFTLADGSVFGPLTTLTFAVTATAGSLVLTSTAPTGFAGIYFDNITLTQTA